MPSLFRFRKDNPIETDSARVKPNPSLLGFADVIAILCLAVLPDLVNCLMAIGRPETVFEYTLNEQLVFLITRSLQVSVPILLIMHLKGVRWSDYGFVPVRLSIDAVDAVGLMIAAYVVYYLSAYFLLLLGVDFSADTNVLAQMPVVNSPSTAAILLILLSSVANGFAEELAMRSYLITRLTEMFGSWEISVVITSLLFASYHLYQGRYGFISAASVGLVFGIYFAVSRRFLPIVIAHALMNAVGFMMTLAHSIE